MKQVFIITILILGLVATYSFAQMQGGMMGSQTEQQTGETSYQNMPCPQMMGSGMMPGMMGYGGYGMMGPGMMKNPGMMHGMGMMGPGMMSGYNAETYQKFLNDTADLRKELHIRKFEYFEVLRNPKTKPEAITKLVKEIQELQSKIYEKTKVTK